MLDILVIRFGFLLSSTPIQYEMDDGGSGDDDDHADKHDGPQAVEQLPLPGYLIRQQIVVLGWLQVNQRMCVCACV